MNRLWANRIGLKNVSKIRNLKEAATEGGAIKELQKVTNC